MALRRKGSKAPVRPWMHDRDISETMPNPSSQHYFSNCIVRALCLSLTCQRQPSSVIMLGRNVMILLRKSLLLGNARIEIQKIHSLDVQEERIGPPYFQAHQACTKNRQDRAGGRIYATRIIL